MTDNPYITAESSAMPQNELEARALIRTASRLNSIKERWPVETAELNEALDLNRKLWTILVTGATEETNPLPVEIKQNIFNLAHFIFKHTFAVMSKPSAQSLEILININMNIARGLNEQSLRRAQQQEAEAQAAAQTEQLPPA